jgi:PAS domain S-box-containing protein
MVMADATQFDSHVSEQRFQLLVNSVTDYAIYMLDPNGRIATWNAGARQFKGYEEHEIIGEHFSRFFTDDDRAAGLPAKALATAAREGRFESEGWRVRKDGTQFWAHVVVDPIRGDSGELLGFAKITRDITEKRAAEQELQSSERRFRMLVQGVRDYAIYMLDTEGRVTNWNTGAEAIKGYTAQEIVGRHFSLFYTDGDRASGEPARALETARREGKYEKEAWRVRKDGTHFWASVVLDPIYGEDGELLGYAKVTRDLTERKLSEQELEEARAALVQSQKLQALGELTGGIAHDFNNLMTVIRGSAELLQRAELSEEKRQRYLQAIVETADRAATLTSHLLAFGRRQPLKPEVIDLNIRLDAFADVLARTLGAPIEVRLDLAPSLWLTEADSAQLETALLNAAFNARDAMPDGGTLTLSTRNVPGDPDRICVSVADTGTGMPPEIAGRAFEPFFTTKPVGKGTGLGLSQIHGFAAQTGGEATIESEAGQGTTINLFLPRTDKISTAAPEATASDRTRTGLTVLLVEDNAHVREFAEHLLADLHYRVVSADCAEAALDVLEREQADIVFTDVVMPGASGIDLARTIHERHPALPVLLASGYSDEIFGGAASEFPILQKPYGAESLGAALARALEQAPGQ